MQSKYILLITLLLLVMFLVVFSSFSTFATSTLYGDADCNKNVEILDASSIQKDIANIKKLTDQGKINAKVENGESLSIVDATLIQKRIANIIDHFPVEETIPTTTPSTECTTTPSTEVTTTPTTEPSTESSTEPSTEKETVTPVNKNITVYFSNNYYWSKVNAYIYNYETDSPMTQWPGSKMEYVKKNNEGEDVYKVNVDLSKYDRIIFNNGTDQTTNTPLTALSSGFFIRSENYGKYVVGVYPYEETNEGTIQTTTLPYPKSKTGSSYNKKITIWLPKGYTKSKKYSVLYALDGQNMFGNDKNCAPFEWEADETILSLQKNGGDGIIVVGIDNTNNRDSELTPPITDHPREPGSRIDFTTPTGDVFSNFVVNTVIPYIDKTYSTNSIRGIVGSSSGGIESFYIGIENPEKFDYIGALSPAFLLFTQNEWDSYLGKKDFSNNNLPKIYFYQGNSTNDGLEQMIYKYGKDMNKWMVNKGYKSTLLKTVTDNDAIHNEIFWTLYLPESINFGLNLIR